MSPLLVVVLIVLVDLLGFAIVMPLLPPFAEHYGFSKTQIGLILAAYPACQLFAGPILGRLSDRYGRRPVLAVSQAGTAISFVILALSHDFWVMLLARGLDGALGGNILVAQAYIADITPPENRARNYGLIGAAFGIGFVLGPILGATMLAMPVSPQWQLRLPFLAAAVLSTIAWVLVLFRLPESLDMTAAGRTEARVLSRRGVLDTIRLPRVGMIVLVGALVTLAFAALEGTFTLFMQGKLGWSSRRAAFGFAFLATSSAVVQGGLIRRLVPKYGEPRLILVGIATLAVGLALMASVENAPTLLTAALIIGVGYGLSSPSISGLLSRFTPPTEQGAVFGVLTSAQTLARLINYVAANRLLDRVGLSAPFWEASIVAVIAFLLAVAVVRSRKPAPVEGL
jgi:DHA1 family tetracycline resistance protein-like MFS transporter